MKLKELLKTITHQNWKVMYVDADVPALMQEPRELAEDEIPNYLDYTVVALDESWNIIIKGQKIA